MSKPNQTNAGVYVGTYAKYNEGNLSGKWLRFDDFADREDMLEACRKLHADEADPELMFQDFEGFPKAFYSETSLPDLWTLQEAITGDLDLSTVCEYLGNIGEKLTPEAIEEACDAYICTRSTFQEYADEQADEMMECHQGHLIDTLKPYFDYEKWARDLKHDHQTVDTPTGEVAIFRNQ